MVITGTNLRKMRCCLVSEPSDNSVHGKNYTSRESSLMPFGIPCISKKERLNGEWALFSLNALVLPYYQIAWNDPEPIMSFKIYNN